MIGAVSQNQTIKTSGAVILTVPGFSTGSYIVPANSYVIIGAPPSSGSLSVNSDWGGASVNLQRGDYVGAGKTITTPANPFGFSTTITIGTLFSNSP